MADIDEMHARGVPFRALVDGSGIAIGGTATMQQLSSAGMMPIAQVDASGVAADGSTLLQLRSRGIPFFCEVSELGIDPVSGDTNRTLANRGIRGDCLLTENGIAQGGTATMVELSRRSIDYFCPVTEAGTEGTVGSQIQLSGTHSIAEGSTQQTTIGTLSISGSYTGTPVFTLVDSDDNRFQLNELADHIEVGPVSTIYEEGNRAITVSVAGVTPASAARDFTIFVTNVIDDVPSAFSFTGVSNATHSTVYTSNTITVLGIDADATPAFSITAPNGGGYSKNGGALATASGTCVLNDTFALSVTSGGADDLTVQITLTINGVSSTYLVSTPTTGGDSAQIDFSDPDATLNPLFI